MYREIKFYPEYSKYYMGSFSPFNEFDGNKFICRSPKIIDGPEIDYIVNAQGFRSQDFSSFDNKKFNILFSGDSFTFGDGLPAEYRYPEMVKSKLKFDTEIYNVAWNGSSIQQTIKNVFAFIRNYGKPNYIICLMPTTERSIFYDKKKKEFSTAMHEVEWVYGNELMTQKEKLRFFQGFVSEENMLKNIDLIYMLEDYCEASNIKLLWTTYDILQQDLFTKCDFKNLFINNVGFLEKNKKNINNMPYWEIAKDNGHPGTKYHDALSDIIVEAIEKNIYE